MKIIVAPDSFKGTLRATQICEIWREALRRHLPAAEIVCIPMSDGGEGALEAATATQGAELRQIQACDALGRPVTAHFALLEQGRTAFVETAQACGLELLAANEKDALHTTSYGAGQLVAEALRAGARHLYIGIGGSAMVDGGSGLLEALGARLLKANGTPIARGGIGLRDLAAIDVSGLMPELRGTVIEVASDVTNPLTGALGAATVFAPQKGASPEQVALLESALVHYGECAVRSGLADRCNAPGDGAAGGLGFALRVFLRAQIRSGARLVAQMTHLPEHLSDASLLITGEGRSDAQTLGGKLPAVLAELAAENGVPALLCSGAVEDCEALRGKFAAVFSTLHSVQPLPEVLAKAAHNLAVTADAIAALLAFRGEK
ncbi:MAG: glycerate kinase [Victivallales bacterium]|nr:glycerate kinase [Victivallales bacterium]